MAEELKSCPFCGGKAYVTNRQGIFGAIVECRGKNCAVCPEIISMRQSDAVAAWNTRADPDVKALVEALEQSKAALDAAPELNMSNYDHDDVAALNDAAIEAWKILDTIGRR